MNKMLFIIALLLVGTAYGQKHGQGSLGEPASAAGLGRGPLPSPTMQHGYFAGAWGVKLDLGWANVDWDVGPASGSERVFAPQASLFYKKSDNLDINLSVLNVSGKDNHERLGATDGEFTRIAMGVRYWAPTQGRVTPFFGGGIGYYLLDGNTQFVPSETEEHPAVDPATVSVKDGPGAFLEAGLAFLISDGFFVNTGLSYDFLLGSSDATINGRDKKFDVNAFLLNLGVMWKF